MSNLGGECQGGGGSGDTVGAGGAAYASAGGYGGAGAPSFALRLIQAAEDSLVKLLAAGEWIKIDYQNKVSVGQAVLEGVFRSLNWGRIQERVIAKVEDRVADTILNSMATEIATDVKKIMSNTELREELRGYLRERMKAGIHAL